MRHRAVFVLTLIAGFSGAFAGPASAACRQALALALDVSGSVDATEYRLQLDGVAGALQHPEVRAALLTPGAAPVRLMVFEWSEQNDIRTLIAWTDILAQTDIDAVATTLRQVQRSPRSYATALGHAMRFGAASLKAQKDCWQHTLDISGDGKSNVGPRPVDVRDGLGRAIHVNGLVIGADARGDQDRRMVEIGELVSYFRAYVIKGPDAFVEVALGFDDYEAAMVRKLKRELQGIVVGMSDP